MDRTGATCTEAVGGGININFDNKRRRAFYTRHFKPSSNLIPVTANVKVPFGRKCYFDRKCRVKKAQNLKQRICSKFPEKPPQPVRQRPRISPS